MIVTRRPVSLVRQEPTFKTEAPISEADTQRSRSASALRGSRLNTLLERTLRSIDLLTCGPGHLRWATGMFAQTETA